MHRYQAPSQRQPSNIYLVGGQPLSGPLWRTRARSYSQSPPTTARPSHESPARYSAGLEIDWWQGFVAGTEANGQALPQTPLGQQDLEPTSFQRCDTLTCRFPSQTSFRIPSPSRLLAQPSLRPLAIHFILINISQTVAGRFPFRFALQLSLFHPGRPFTALSPHPSALPTLPSRHRRLTFATPNTRR